MQKPSIPKGTRDFSPAEMVNREYIFDTIKGVFRKYGYSPMETPAMENLSTLLGKYGEEGDKLLFKILNSGNFLNKTDLTKGPEADSNNLSLQICEKGLRYDLTVPFARYVVQNRNDITFPFKRYQIQPVWRADRPQKGRYREFYQCDADVIGSNSLLNELELIQIIEEVFSKLRIQATIKINNRKILAGIAKIMGQSDRLSDITVAIDKIEKAGFENVMDELKQRGLSLKSIKKLRPFLQIKGTYLEIIAQLKPLLANSASGQKGIEEMETLFKLMNEAQINVKTEFDITLARGLNYYTGAIIEVKANKVEIGSICGGGRYDDLTGIFGLPDVSGVGISFGADRIYDVLNQLDLFYSTDKSTTQVLLINFGEKEQKYCLNLLRELRQASINVEMYPDTIKLKKQMEYANARKIPYVLLAGEEEITSGLLTLKDMTNGSQIPLSIEDIILKLSK
jgi:histidyl-tRNA synthetase